MEIKAKSDDRFEIKTKQATIAMADTVSVNDVELAGPGEYEIGDCKILGLLGAEPIYLIESENLKLAYLDRLKAMLSDEQIEQLQEPDILMIPTGGAETLSAKDAERLVGLIDPKVVIPMVGDLASFAKKLVAHFETVSSLKLTQQTVPEEGRKVVVIKP